MIVKNSSLSVDTEKLRKKILDLAMRGKLIPQDSQDEPASVLLEKIKEEKAQLIKEKKIKKSKPLPEITEEEKPFEIPESWEWVRLENVASSIGDGLHGTPKYDKNGEIPFINGSNLKNDKITITDNTKYINDEEYRKIYVNLNQSTILMSLNGTLGNLAKYRSNEKISLGKSAGYISLITKDIYDFVYISLKSPMFKAYYSKKATRTTIKNISLKDIRSTPIPLPPLAEQKRIVAKVEECMQAIKIIEDSSKEYEKLENQLDKKVLDLAMRGKLVPQDSQDEPASVLLEKIKEEKAQLIKEKKIKKSKPLPEITEEEKPFEIPESWEWVRLGEVSAINTGNTPSKKYKEYYGGDLPFVKPADINNNHINYDTDEKLTDKGKEKGRIASPNDILITCIGNLGRNYFLDKDVAFNQQINAVTPINIEKIWLHYTLLSSFFIQQMYNNASATTVSILNKTKLERLLVPLPPLAEQKRIVTKIKGIEIYLKN
ncbi:restriction endonuclease subunit S [Ligilactobacillus salivarius]|uniref:restriction endonuclease subunit S n=1 Tax=Ligilactobacillus salivarius TaxID=1624 RepID=UPI000BAE7D21|nr:restriction endonuclease subunit S [Ligilactobacillus salivarius]